MKHLSILLTLCIAIFSTSCSDSENQIVTTTSFNQIYTVTDNTGNTTAFPSCVFTYEIDFTTGLMNITMADVKFSTRMPMKITLLVKDIPFTTTQYGVSFSGKNIVPLYMGKETPEYTLSSISGHISSAVNANGDICNLTFNVNDTYNVTAYSTPIIFEHECSTRVTESPENSNTFIHEKAFYVIKFNEDMTQADIYLYDITFSDKMKVTLNLILKGINVTGATDGIRLSAENVNVVMNDQVQTPMNESFQITDLNGTIQKDYLQFNFNCTIKDSGNSLTGQTYYVTNSAYCSRQAK